MNGSIPKQFVEFVRVMMVAISNLWPRLQGDVAQGWIINGEALERVLAEVLLPPAKKQEETVAHCIQPLTISVQVYVQPRCKVSECFKFDNKFIFHRDSDLDHWLSGHVPAVNEGRTATYELTKPEGTTLREIVEEIIGIKGSNDTLKLQLKARNLTFHPKQIEDLIYRTNKGERTGLLMDGKANLFFIEDEVSEIFSVCVLCRGGSRWDMYVYKFGHHDRWIVGRRVFFRKDH